MNILIINELKSFGGTEVQTEREINNFKKHGHSVSLLNFDSKYPLCINSNEKQEYNIPVKFNNLQKTIHRIILSSKYQKLILQVLELVKPDVIHINHVKSLPLDVFKATGNIPTIQTLRDYSFICPKGTSILKNGEKCRGYKKQYCKKCIIGNFKLLVKYITLKKVNSFRLNYVQQLVAPSQALANACTENGLPTLKLNNPFDFTILKKKEQTYNSNIYLYYGEISEKKGITQMIEAFKRFHEKYENSKLYLIGILAKEYVEKFESIIDKNYMYYKGRMKNEDIMELYKQIYCVIVPSFWIENYPNTVLEAIANKTLVIGSNRGGIPELVGNDMFLFDILNVDDLTKKLCFTKELSEKDYIEITNARYNYIKENNSLEIYYQRLLNIYGTLTKK